MTTNKIKDTFEYFIDRIDNELDIGEIVQKMESYDYSNYRNELVQLPNPFESGDMAKFKDKHGRVGVVFFTDIGNVVVFLTHSLVYMSARCFLNLMPNGPIEEDFLFWMKGDHRANRFQLILNDIMKATAEQMCRHNKASA